MLTAAVAGSAAVVGAGVGSGGVGSGAVRVAGAATTTRPDPGTLGRVVVVGAGLAGLSAGVALTDGGWDVRLLEARERVGGRVHTLYSPFAGGQHAEGGGESIDTNHDHIAALLRRFGLGLVPRPADKLLAATVFRGGRRVRLSDMLTEDGGKVGAGYVGFGNGLASLVPGLDPAHPELAADADRWDAQSLEDYLGRQQLDPGAEFLVRTGFRATYNAELSEISLLFIAQQQLSDPVPESGVERYRVEGGNSRLPEAMARHLGDRVTLGAALTRVERRPWGVRVTAGHQVVDAARLVLATPAATLRRVSFAPALPGEAAAMVAGLSLGPALKVAHQFRTRFWRAGGGSGFTLTDLPFGVGWDATDSMGGTSGILTQFVTGAPAVAGAALPAAARIRGFGRQLTSVYPAAAAEHMPNVATVAWHDEPFTTGGYAVYAPGQLTRFWPVLRRPLGPIWFAGEHTETIAGYMESAVRSGQRVAAALGRPPVGDGRSVTAGR